MTENIYMYVMCIHTNKYTVCMNMIWNVHNVIKTFEMCPIRLAFIVECTTVYSVWLPKRYMYFCICICMLHELAWWNENPFFFNSTQNILYIHSFIHHHSSLDLIECLTSLVCYVLYTYSKQTIVRIRIHTHTTYTGRRIWTTTTRNEEEYLWITVFSTVRNIWFQ